MSRSVLYTSSPLLASKTPVWRSKFIVAMIALGFVALAGRAAPQRVLTVRVMPSGRENALVRPIPGLVLGELGRVQARDPAEAHQAEGQTGWLRGRSKTV